MSIRTRLFLAFLFLTVLPLAIISYNDLHAIGHVSELTVAESTQHMKELGQTSIRQKALDVAMQAQLYFEAHPELLSNMAQMMADKKLAGIAVQPVGVTGYTALYDSKGITYFQFQSEIGWAGYAHVSGNTAGILGHLRCQPGRNGSRFLLCLEGA